MAALAACTTRDPADPAVVFWNELRSLCGRSFFGSPVAVSALDSAVIGQTLVLNVWQCWNDELRLAFHIGDDHSRVWVLAWDQQRLTLNHSVHGPDGQPAEFTNYGGPASSGTDSLQTFTADAETLVRFPSAGSSVWTLELIPDQRLTYAFDPGNPAQRFRIHFDLRNPAPRPPNPWGWTRNNQPTGQR